jgi:Ca2+/H+ antiporter, TMEM165/GDT1 family
LALARTTAWQGERARRAEAQTMHPLTQFWTAALPAFLASFVEFVEALTVVLAVGITRGWRSAIAGSIAAMALLGLLVVAFGPMLTRFPIAWLQIAVGWLLILFGMRWLRKAILRAGGVISMHDEAGAFEQEKRELEAADGRERRTLDPIGFLTAFKAVTLEGLEVVFIVIAVGATANALIPASAGAAVAGILVVVAGVVLQHPLSRVPENSLKFVVGVMLSSFGTFWFGEGVGMKWVGDDLAILGLIVLYGFASVIAIALCRRSQIRPVAAARVSQT